jgi:uncharacterized membrane protein YebE (DUF533 family)
MFDARSILDVLLGGGPPGARGGQPADPNVFRDMLDQLGTQGSPTATSGRSTAPQPTPGGRWTEQRDPQSSPETSGRSAPPGGGMGLEDLLRTILTGGAPPQAQSPQQAPAGAQPPAPQGGQTGQFNPEVTKELQDLLRQILQGGLGASTAQRIMGDAGGGAGGPGDAGGLGGILRQVLGQATSGAREGAARIDEATGLSDKAREAIGQVTGQTPEALVARVRELIADNQLAAGTALGGLGALILGTGAGRSLAGTAVKLGGLALIGGLAYKAYENYQQGRPPLSAGQPAKPQALMPAPEGSGFEAGAMGHDAARRCIRAMIAAAAADGRIDVDEQQRIVAGLRQAGIAETAQQFLAAEIANPANVDELASRVSSPEEAVQVYTAARIAVDPDTGEEHAFLSALANALGIDRDLAAQVDAAARITPG